MKPPDAILLRATGYLELGMPADALTELEDLPTGSASTTGQHLRVEALFQLHDWKSAVKICLRMLEQEPEDPNWWVQAAYAQRRCTSIEDAEPILRRALARHPEHFLIRYNLACYACVGHREEEAKDHLRGLIVEDAMGVVPMAKKDSDLAALHGWLHDLGGNALQ